MRDLFSRFSAFENIFSAEFLVPLLERYSLHISPSTPWVPEAFLESGVAHEMFLQIVNDIFDRVELPFNTKVALAKLASDNLFVLRNWYEESARHGIRRIGKPIARSSGLVRETLDSYSKFAERAGEFQKLKRDIIELQGLLV